MKNFIFIAAGGKGNRLRSSLSLEVGLPKALAVVINNRPLIAYQLDILVKFGLPVVISFSNQKSVNKFERYLREGRVPSYNYLIDLHPYHQDNEMIDIIKSSKPHRPWDSKFDSMLITAEDVYCKEDHFSKMFLLQKETGYNILTIYNFEKYMLTLKSHPHFSYDRDSNLTSIFDGIGLPKEVFFLPQLITEETFRIYSSLPAKTHRSIFVKTAFLNGVRFKILKPKVYVNLKYLQDYKKLMKVILES